MKVEIRILGAVVATVELLIDDIDETSAGVDTQLDRAVKRTSNWWTRRMTK